MLPRVVASHTVKRNILSAIDTASLPLGRPLPAEIGNSDGRETEKQYYIHYMKQLAF